MRMGPIRYGAYGVASAVISGWGYCQYRQSRGDTVNYWPILQPIINRIDPEKAHEFGIWLFKQPRAFRRAVLAVDSTKDDPILNTTVWDINFENPIGFAAGFDKNGEAIQGILECGFAFVEIGSVTGDPQPGNPKPRVFRYPEHQAIINRYGFNSDGHQAVRKKLQRLPEDLPGVLGVNLGRNKYASTFDFVKGVKVLGKYADYITINVSSPNTPGLRGLQNKKELVTLINTVRESHKDLGASIRTGKRIPLLLKIAPDLSNEELMDIANVSLTCGIDGIIVSNTTISRPADSGLSEIGGLSGKPLFDASTDCLRKMYGYTKGRIILIGAGGVSSGHDAYAKIRAGASLVQIYSAFVFGGPPLMSKIKRELAGCLRRDGFRSISDAVGADFKK